VPASSVKLPPDAPASWRERLSGALGERLQVHVGRSGEQAVIRLDPPQLGRIDISIRHETGALQVHLSASNGDVLRQLAGMGEGLRQDLAQRRHGDVAVTVSDRLSDGARDGGGRPPRQPAADTEDNAPGRALADAEAGAAHVPFATAPDRE
jgi:flagellar hook-length control protein FliK